MGALRLLDTTGKVEQILYTDDSTRSIVSSPVDSVRLDFAGIEADCHAGTTRKACSRFQHVYEKGALIRNSRQLTVVSREELALIAADLELDHLPAAWLGANMVLSGIPHLTLLPPSSRLKFESGAILVVDLENRPCVFPAKVIEEQAPGKGKRFVSAAGQRRGFTCWVERPGDVAVGQTASVFAPAQKAYPG
jgi:hypothetical protein